MYIRQLLVTDQSFWLYTPCCIVAQDTKVVPDMQNQTGTGVPAASLEGGVWVGGGTPKDCEEGSGVACCLAKESTRD